MLTLKRIQSIKTVLFLCFHRIHVIRSRFYSNIVSCCHSVHGNTYFPLLMVTRKWIFHFLNVLFRYIFFGVFFYFFFAKHDIVVYKIYSRLSRKMSFPLVLCPNRYIIFFVEFHLFLF